MDTQAWLWWVLDDARLGRTAREIIATGRPVLSVVSSWEVAIKVSLGKLDADLRELMAVADRQGVERLALTEEHVLEVAVLPQHHRDPFDRMLIAQARAEGVGLLTADRALAAYDCALLSARA